MFKSYIVFCLPLVFKYLFILLFSNLYLVEIGDVAEDVFFTVAIILLLALFIKPFFRHAIFLLFTLYFVLETASYLAVSSNFSSSFMYLLIESNPQELREFGGAYLNTPILIFIALAVFWYSIVVKKRLCFNLQKYWGILILSFLGIIGVLKFTGLIENNAYHNVVRGVYGYFELQNSVKFNSEISKEDISIQSDNEVFVFVLGESTTRGHMQIYDYNRETTPLLNSIKDSLYIYNNVVSTDVLTLKAVPKILSSLDVNSKKENLFNIVEVFNAAGYDSYWLSNQRPISYNDNAISKIASVSDNLKFYNHLIDKYTEVLDEILLPDYNKILNISGKKVVFVRLIGTHFDYNRRYPESYNKFALQTENISKEQLIKNYYDNAVLYNDYIVYTLIKDLQKINAKSALLYLSDHGENLYDNTDFFGRSEEIITKSMFEIPFILWTSKDFEFPHDFEYDANRRFMADHTYESAGHVFGVLHKGMDINRSIFSKFFEERQRTVINKFDFDTYFIKK